jgi:hypothetical protein
MLVQTKFTTAVPNLRIKTFDGEKITTAISLNSN